MNNWLHQIDYDRLVALRRANSRGLDRYIATMKLPLDAECWSADTAAQIKSVLREAVREFKSYGRAIKHVHYITSELVGRIPKDPAELAGHIASIEFLCDTSDCSAELFERNCRAMDCSNDLTEVQSTILITT